MKTTKWRYLMRYDIGAVAVKQHGPGYRPQDGDERWVDETAVQNLRDHGWIIRHKHEVNS